MFWVNVSWFLVIKKITLKNNIFFLNIFYPEEGLIPTCLVSVLQVSNEHILSSAEQLH